MNTPIDDLDDEQALIAELERRFAEYERDPGAAISWEELKAESDPFEGDV